MTEEQTKQKWPLSSQDSKPTVFQESNKSFDLFMSKHILKDLHFFTLILNILCFDVLYYLLLFSRSVVSNSLQPRELQHTRIPCPSPSPGVCSNSRPLNQWCHPTISSSVIPFSCFQSFPASGSFPTSQLFTSDGQSIGASASASVLPMSIQG